MVKIVSQDDGRGGSKGSNNCEYGGYIDNGTVTPVDPGPVVDPAKGESASLKIPEGYNSFHSHPSGGNGSDYNPNSVFNNSTPSHQSQIPSTRDLNTAGNNTHYVFGRWNKKVYIYTKDGVQAEMSMKDFINLSK